MQKTWVRFLGWEDLLEKGKASHSSILAWRSPWTIYPWGRKELDMTEQLSLSEGKRAFLVAQTVKSLCAVQETSVQSLGREDPLEEGMATHSSVFA